MNAICLLLVCLSISSAQEVIRGTASFATKLYDVLPKSNDNLIFSPLSVHAVLSLTYQGAAGKTAESLSKGLSVPDTLTTAKQYKDIIDVLNSKGNVTIELANKVYVKEGYKLKDSFRKVATDYFSAEADSINFLKKAEAAATINTWVRNKTHDKIDQLVTADDLTSDTRVVLLNAIYFKGLWKEPFEKRLTKTDKFYISETETVECDMMRHMGYFSNFHYRKLDAHLIKIPYQDSRFNMIVVLPNKKTGIKELEQKLTSVDINSVMRDIRNTLVILYLPKFKIESKIPLKEPLKAAGLSQMFEATEFPNLIDRNESLKIDNVIQKAFIEVNEEGAEAAAATSVVGGIGVSGGGFLHTTVFKADHPFIFYISVNVDDENVTLFMGRANKVSK